MFTAVTNGVRVSVTTDFQEEYSSFEIGRFVFTYKILIENNSDFTVKLLRRHWFIFDSNGNIQEVEGEGVIGEQPVIDVGGKHQYVSGCHLETDIGKMAGTYLMERVIDGEQLEIMIPDFTLMAPARLN